VDLVVFEENKPLVLEALENGEFDYIEAASEVFETEFFKYIGAKEILAAAAETYPTPRKKQEVPLWLYIASELTMRLHGVNSYNAYPSVIRTGGMLNAFSPKIGRKTVHPDTKEITVACEGFNRKNHYDRQTPCDSDFLRKLAKNTMEERLMWWFNVDISRIFKTHHAFDKEGIFIGDGSYLFVPDNTNYEGSECLLFDQHNHPVSQEDLRKMSTDEKVRCQWRRCYKMVTLLHTNAKLEYFLLVSVKIVSGKDHECPLLYDLVNQFVQAVGKGVIKKLILDRGFLDGAEISRCKTEHDIDVLIPVRKNMDIYRDAMPLFQSQDVAWVVCEESRQEKPTEPPPRLKPLAIRKREQKRQETLKERNKERPAPSPDTVIVETKSAAIGDFRSWSSCSVPLTVIANREQYADGHEDTWLLLSTQKACNPVTARQEYHLRTATEERYRQLKCFTDLTGFTSRAFSEIVNQVVFIMLAYDLLQLFLLREGREEFTAKTPLSVRRELLPASNHVIVYNGNYYGLFTPMELIELMTLRIGEEARRKIGEKCRRLRRELTEVMCNPRPP